MNEVAGPLRPPEGIVEEDTTVVARDGYEIPVRLYKPKTPMDGSPLIVIYHGGGFCLGDLSNEELNSRNFAKAFGAVCINVDYRLAPENKFPAAVNDSWDVLRWVRPHYLAQLLWKDLTIYLGSKKCIHTRRRPVQGFHHFWRISWCEYINRRQPTCTRQCTFATIDWCSFIHPSCV
jgi:hypothetical protein